MKTKVAIVSAAIIASAVLPSCTSTGGLDPGFANLAGELGDGYFRYEEMRAEQEAAQYQRFLDAQALKQQQAEADAQAQALVQPTYPFTVPTPGTDYSF